MPVLRSHSKSIFRDNYQSKSSDAIVNTHSRRLTKNSKFTTESSPPRAQLSNHANSKEKNAPTLTTAVQSPVLSKLHFTRIPQHGLHKTESDLPRIKRRGCKKKTPAAGGSKMPGTFDPYALDHLSDSGDEKENIDPNAAKQLVTVKQGNLLQRGRKGPSAKLDWFHHFRQTSVDDLRSPQLLTGRPTLTKPQEFSKSVPKADICYPGTLPVGINSSTTSSKTLAQQERRKSANTTIYLPLPRSNITSGTAGTSIPLASTPVGPSSGGGGSGGITIDKLNVPPQITPVIPQVAYTLPLPVETDVVTEGSAKALVPAVPTAVLSDAGDSIKSSERSNETLPSGSSGTRGSGHSGRRRMSESEKREAYNSWLDEFNSYLEQFESHDLTIDE